MIPCKLRTCITGVWIFKTNNTDWEAIFEEVLFGDKKMLKHIILTKMAEKHSFMYIKLDDYSIYVNWQQIYTEPYK